MRLYILKAALLTYCIILAFNAFGKTLTFNTKGYDTNGKLLFTENYALEECNNKIQKIQTEFFDPKGILVGEMTSNFENAPFLPQLLYKKKVQNLEFGTSVSNQKVEAYKIFKNEKKKAKTFKLEHNMVSGHGFYAYILDQLDDLLAGGKTLIHYLQPARLSTFAFFVEATVDPNNIDIAHVKLKIQKAHLKPFVPDIHLSIQRSTKRILSYKGAYEGFSGGFGLPKVVTIEFLDYKEI